MKIYIVISFNLISGVSFVNTWPFSTKEKAQAFIDSGNGDWVTAEAEFQDRADCYAIREEEIDGYSTESEKVETAPEIMAV